MYERKGSKRHAVCDGDGKPALLAPPKIQVSDHRDGELFLDSLPRAKAILAGHGDDKNWPHGTLIGRGITPCPKRIENDLSHL